MSFQDIVLKPTGRPPETFSVAVPADKSISHRIAMLMGLGQGRCRVENYPKGADNQTTLSVMQALGAKIERLDDTGDHLQVEIEGNGGHVAASGGVSDPLLLDCGNSGTTTRIMMGAVAGLPVTATFDGDASLRKRPMRRVTDHLLAMGAKVAPFEHDNVDLLPLAIQGGQLDDYTLDNVKASAQVKSAVLFAALTSGCTVEISEPYTSRDHSELLLKALGYPLKTQGNQIHFASPGLAHENFSALQIPGDPSSAAFWLALGSVSESAATVTEVCMNPTRTGFFDALVQIGVEFKLTQGRVSGGEQVADVTASGRPAKGIVVAGETVVRAIDELPMLALLGLFLPAGEAIEIRDAAELRVKETDRIAAVEAAVHAFGGEVESGADWLRVGPGKADPVGPVVVDALHDHRIAMAAAVVAIGLGCEIKILGGDVARISYPGFWQQLTQLGFAERQR